MAKWEQTTDPTRQRYLDPAAAARQARDKVAAARVWLMKHKPFFGVLVRALKLQASIEVPGFRLHPDDRLLFNPVVTLEARFPALCARLAHLSLHAALGAFGRRREREPRRWNVAHDLAIAPLLEAAGLGVGLTTIGHLEGLAPRGSAESYFEQLPEGTMPHELWCDLCEPPAAETSHAAGQYTRQDDGTGSGEPETGAHGDAPPDGADPQPEVAPEGRLPVDVPNAETRGHELMWKMRLGAAYEEELASGGKTFGDMPEWLDDMLRATIEPPADWSVELQRTLSALQRTDRTYLRPSRRMSALAALDGAWPDTVSMPGRRIEPAGQLVAVVDTSASVNAATLERFLGVVASTATAEGIDEVRLLQADAVVTRDETRFAAELLFEAIPITGRGGTDYGPALLTLADDAKRLGQRFTVVYLTDLEGRYPAAPAVRHLDVLWVTADRRGEPPPFGRWLSMSAASG
ncbi:MAG: hypothetical protein KC731_20725 [Myxococcales bacterium]|nr:hypothetical protein [Myxococcales bacterium]